MKLRNFSSSIKEDKQNMYTVMKELKTKSANLENERIVNKVKVLFY